MKKQLAYLAYSMTVKTKKTISETELRDILIESYSELDGSFNPEIPKTNVDEYIKWVLLPWSRGDIFKVCRNYDGENIYQFEHLLFQEYFTAYAISKLYCPNVNRRTQPIDILEPYFKEINGSGWREIILMVALMENTAIRSLEGLLDTDSDTVGIAIDVQHVKATAVGQKVYCKATVSEIDGRRIRFEIGVWDDKGAVGHAVHDRFIINPVKFMSKL